MRKVKLICNRNLDHLPLGIEGIILSETNDDGMNTFCIQWDDESVEKYVYPDEIEILEVV